MSDAHNHESAIRTPKQLAAAVIGFFLITVLGIALLVQFVPPLNSPAPAPKASLPKPSASACSLWPMWALR